MVLNETPASVWIMILFEISNQKSTISFSVYSLSLYVDAAIAATTFKWPTSSSRKACA